MTNLHLADKVREFRTRKGLSQEALAEASGISHRTVQRIENGKSNPTGDTLRRLAAALSVNPDDLVDWTIKEDNSFLVYLNLSALTFLVFPILGILVPFMMWTSKKDKFKDVNKVGIELVNFELNWTILLVVITLGLFFAGWSGHIPEVSIKDLIILALSMYILNTGIILINSVRTSQRKRVVYYSIIRFLK